tara:strand:- start:1133 stop:1867 length:735 start_codon:yes stop_codon:yes gene_type:complete
MIKINDLYKSFGDKEILKGLNLTINDGECVCIIGKSGIGKSILLKHITGLMVPDVGEVWLHDQMINSLSFKELQKIRSRIGMVFQFGALFDFMTVLDNLALPLKKLTDYSDHKIIELSEKALKEVGLENVGNLMPSELSGGMKKRVSIARAIVGGPDYILYDEPTTGLDPIMTDVINRLIKKIHIEENLTSIIVTHEMRTVYTVADRVLFLDDGLIKYDGTPQNMKNTDDKTILQFLAGSSSLA